MRMKIAWISSWPPRPCGIATYSSELVEALRDAGEDVHIICHPDGGSPGEKNVYPVVNTEEVGWDEKVYSVVKEIKPQVVHIQHEYGLYQTCNDYAAGLFRPLFRWKMAEKFPLVATYHSVYTSLGKVRAWYMDLMQKIVDAGIVHEYYQWVNLPANIGRMVDNVYVIPHGTKLGVSVSKHDAKKSLDLEGKKVVGMLGWFTSTKGFDRVIKMWDSISRKLGPDTVLALAGEARAGDPFQKEYKQKLLSLVQESRSRDKVKVVLGSFSPQEYDRILASFDVMVMPYTFASQSGNLAHSFALGVPVVASSLEGLKAEIEASGAGMLVPPEDDEELEKAILTLMRDNSLRKKYSQRATTYVKERISWPIIAEKHIRLYKKLVEGRATKEKDIKSEVMLES
jgi:glycosyltransferase involved in cell wall biosynthesis